MSEWEDFCNDLREAILTVHPFETHHSTVRKNIKKLEFRQLRLVKLPLNELQDFCSNVSGSHLEKSKHLELTVSCGDCGSMIWACVVSEPEHFAMDEHAMISSAYQSILERKVWLPNWLLKFLPIKVINRPKTLNTAVNGQQNDSVKAESRCCESYVPSDFYRPQWAVYFRVD